MSTDSQVKVLQELISMWRLRAAAKLLRPEVSLHAVLYDCIGAGRQLHAAVLMLERLIEWSPAAWHRDGWIYKSEADWFIEIRVGKSSIPRAATALSAAGVETVIASPAKMRTGHLPSLTRHFRINVEKFLARFAAAVGATVERLIDVLRGDVEANSTPGNTTVNHPITDRQQSVIGALTDGDQGVDGANTDRQQSVIGVDQSLSINDSETDSNADSNAADSDRLRAGNPVFESAWSALAEKLDAATYQTFVKGARLLSAEGNVYRIGVPNAYTLDMMLARLYRDVKRELAAAAGEAVEVYFEVVSSESDAMPLFVQLAHETPPPLRVEKTVEERFRELVKAGKLGRGNPENVERFAKRKYGLEAIAAGIRWLDERGGSGDLQGYLMQRTTAG